MTSHHSRVQLRQLRGEATLHASHAPEEEKPDVVFALDVEAGDLDVRTGWVIAVGMVVIDIASKTVLMKRRIVIPPNDVYDRRFDGLLGHGPPSVLGRGSAAHVLADGGMPGVNAACRPYVNPRVYTSFWKRHMGVFQQLQSEIGVRYATAAEAWRAIERTIADVFVRNGRVILVSDCPDFDLGVLNHRLSLYGTDESCWGLRYTRSGERSMVRNPQAEIVGFPVETQRRIRRGVQYGTFHMPDDDAHRVGMMQVEILHELEN